MHLYCSMAFVGVHYSPVIAIGVILAMSESTYLHTHNSKQFIGSPLSSDNNMVCLSAFLVHCCYTCMYCDVQLAMLKNQLRLYARDRPSALLIIIICTYTVCMFTMHKYGIDFVDLFTYRGGRVHVID